MRMHVTVQVAERGYERRLHRLAQIENHRASTLKRVGHQETIFRHLLFGVVRCTSWTGHANRRHRLSVTRRLGISINDREKITAFLGVIACPDKKVGMTLTKSSESPESEKEVTRESSHGRTL